MRDDESGLLELMVNVQRRFFQTVSCTLLTTTLSWAGPVLNILPRQHDSRGKQARVSELRAAEGVLEARTALRSATRMGDERLERWLRVEVQDEASLETLLATLSADPGIEVVERAPVRTITVSNELDGLSNDPLVSFQWHLDHINAYAAWDLVSDASGVVIAVIDNGTDMDHPDLEPIFWRNEAEWGGTRLVDDDNNGYVDDINGWDFFANDGNPDAPVNVSSASHGTHTAGIAAAAHNNRIGVSGIAPGVRLMVIRAGQGTQIGEAVEGMIYAVDNGADIISMSFSGSWASVFEQDAVRYAHDNGVLMVAASGNEGSQTLSYPAAYEGVIGVAATNLDNRVASFSNTGHWVDIAAPGVDILSTVINGYDHSTGTSMSAPLVAGMAALIFAQNPDVSLDEVRSRLLQGSQPLSQTPNGGYPKRMADAWRVALSERPVVLVHGVEILDDGNNGLLEPGEGADLLFDLELVGGAASNVSFSVRNANHNLDVQADLSWSDLQPGVFTSDPVFVLAETNAPRGFAPLQLTLLVDGYEESSVIDLPIDPKWRTHQAGRMVATVTDFGAIGYRDYVFNADRGEGVRLLEKPTGFLFHGSVMVSNGTNVSDCAFGNNSQDQYDFFTTTGGQIRLEASQPSAQVYAAQYTDGAAFGAAGVVVNQTTTSYPGGDEIVYIDLSVIPVAGGTGEYNVGIFCDWDIGNANDNIVRYYSAEKLSYVLGPNGAAGIMVVGNATISGVAAINNPSVVYDGFTDAEKAGLMASGTSGAVREIPGDVSNLVAVRITNVTPQNPGIAHFALLAASNESDLIGMVLKVANRPGTDPVDGPLPTAFSLADAWPNPFNSATSLTITLPATGNLRVEVHDLLGRRVIALADAIHQAGRHRFVWDGRSSDGKTAASGTYFIQANWEGKQEVRKVALVR